MFNSAVERVSRMPTSSNVNVYFAWVDYKVELLVYYVYSSPICEKPYQLVAH